MTGRKMISIMVIIALAASSLPLIQATSAQTIPKPSVPEFTLNYVFDSYYVEPTYGVDQYTGQSVQTGGGCNVRNNRVVVTIKNSGFSPYTDGEGNRVGLYYNVTFKGHYEGDWMCYNIFDVYYYESETEKFEANHGSDTVFVFGLSSNDMPEGYDGEIYDVSEHGKVDFKIQAYTASLIKGKNTLYGTPFAEKEWYDLKVVGESGWSPVHTVEIGEINPTLPSTDGTEVKPTTPDSGTFECTETPRQSDTQSSMFFGFSWEQVVIVAMIVVITGLTTALVLSRRKKP